MSLLVVPQEKPKLNDDFLSDNWEELRNTEIQWLTRESHRSPRTNVSTAGVTLVCAEMHSLPSNCGEGVDTPSGTQGRIVSRVISMMNIPSFGRVCPTKLKPSF